MTTYPDCPVYLFYGNQVEPILKARDQVLDRFLPREERYQSLTEFYPTSNTATIKLADNLGDIAGELATMSFIEEATKCVVVTNPAELFAGGGARRAPKRAAKKASAKKSTKSAKSSPSAGDPVADWIQNELAATGHKLILLAFEDEAAGREINDRSPSPLLQTIMKLGYAQAFRNQKAFFRIESGLLNRDVNATLDALRELWGPRGGDTMVYNALVRCLRYLIQANIARERKLGADPAMMAACFPSDRQRNLFQAHPAVQRKYTTQPIYSTLALLDSYQELLDVYRAMRPRPGDLFVPDAQGLLEQSLLKLLTSPRPRSRR